MDPNHNQGLFADEFIPAGAAITVVDLKDFTHDEFFTNDPQVNLTAFYSATTGVEMYDAVAALHRNYYNHTTAASRCNTVTMSYGDELVLCARVDIPAGAELFRCYDFPYWVAALLQWVTPHTITGYAVFVRKYCAFVPSDVDLYHARSIRDVMVQYYNSINLPLSRDTIGSTSAQIVLRYSDSIIPDITEMVRERFAAS